MTILTGIILCLSLSPGDQTLITRSGEKYTGSVTAQNDVYIVRTRSGTRKIPAAQVGCVFTEVREAAILADDRFYEARKLWEDARKLREDDPARNEKLKLAVEIAQGSAEIYRLLEPHFPGQEYAYLGKNVQKIMQFVRLCREVTTSDVAGAPRQNPSKIVPLAGGNFAFPAPPPPPRPWIFEEELGPGQGAIARDLGDPDSRTRLEAVRRLTHPPAPDHLPVLARLFENETDEKIRRVLTEGLGLMDPAATLKFLGGLKRSPDPSKRAVLFGILRSSVDRSACDFLAEWLAESPPAEDGDRAEFATSFRRLRAFAASALNGALSRTKDPRVRTEIIKQMGVRGDKAFAQALVDSIPTHGAEAAVALLKIGKPALPTLITGARSPKPEMRRVCGGLCRKITGTPHTNVDRFDQWWSQNKRAVADEEKARASEDGTVGPEQFADYSLPLDGLID